MADEKGKKKDSRGEALDASAVDRRSLKLRYRAKIGSTRESIGRITDELLIVAEKAGCDKDELTDLAIALREALANAIIHGNESDPEKRVLIRCYTHEHLGMLVAIRDEGKGFDPDELPDPTHAERIHLHHGRGVYMMRELMDQVMHRKGGREIVLYKRPSKEANGSGGGSEGSEK